MIKIKDKRAIDKMRKAGQLLAGIMDSTSLIIKSGVSTLEIDSHIEKEMKRVGLRPECKGYRGYMHSSCISVNDVIVHGVPSANQILKDGDFVKIDMVGSYKNYCADMARYFFVGQPSSKAAKLAQVAQRALDKAIGMSRPGVRLSDISHCIQQEVEAEGFGVVRDFVGHGIGKSMHEEPQIPNYGKPGKGPTLRPGMVLAIEPMITEGKYQVVIDSDGWTARTADGGLAGHVEDTILITEGEPEVLTRKIA